MLDDTTAKPKRLEIWMVPVALFAVPLLMHLGWAVYETSGSGPNSTVTILQITVARGDAPPTDHSAALLTYRGPAGFWLALGEFAAALSATVFVVQRRRWLRVAGLSGILVGSVALLWYVALLMLETPATLSLTRAYAVAGSLGLLGAASGIVVTFRARRGTRVGASRGRG